MKKRIIFIISILSLILFIKSDDKNINNNQDENFDDDFDDDGYFKSSLKEYLLKKQLFDSEKVINPEEMKKIFLDVITEGGPENSPPHLRNIFSQLADHFIKRYYSDKKQIKGKDIYNLFDINEISTKFDELVGDTPLYDDYSEEEDDTDNRDSIGEPKTEL